MRIERSFRGWKPVLSTLIASLALLVPGAAFARCVGADDPVVQQAELEIGRNPAAAIAWIDRAIARTDPDDRRRVANLHLAQTIAYSMDGQLDAKIFDEAERLAAEFPASDPINLFVRIPQADRLEDKADREEARQAILQDVETLPANAGTRACLGLDLAVSYSDDNNLQRAFDLTSRAYRNTDGDTFPRAHAEAASILGYLVSIGRDFEYALRLHSEALDFYLSNELYDLAANEHVVRGYTELEADNIQDALADFEASVEQAKSYGNSYAVAYAEQGLCLAALEGGMIARARPACIASYDALDQANEPMAYRAGVAKGMLLLAEGRASEALKAIERVFERKYKPLGYEDEIEAYETRAKALSALGRSEEAYQDMVRAAKLTSDDHKIAQASATGVAQARFQTRQLKSELAQEQRSSQESRRLALAVIIGSATGLVLLGMLVFTLLRHRSEFRKLAMLDPLTNLANRRATLHEADEILGGPATIRPRATTALLDIDRFKRCNDRFGHDAGDQILREFARVVKRCVRPDDIVGRWGGEEFLVIFPALCAEKAEQVIERIRREAEVQPFELAPDFTLRFSAGIAEIEEAGDDMQECIRLADRRLYQAKAMGRHRTCSRGPGIDPLASIGEQSGNAMPGGSPDHSSDPSRSPSA